MITKVIDTNSLDADELETFLQTSKHHVAVLAEWQVIETLNGNDPVASLGTRFLICRKYRSQFILVKEAPILVQVRGRAAGLVSRLVDQSSDTKLAGLLASIRSAERGDAMAIDSILRKKSDAEAFLDRLLGTAGGLAKWYAVFQSEYSEADLKIIRTGSAFNHSILSKMTKSVRDLTGFFLADRNGEVKWPRPLELPNIFHYRLSLVLQLHFFDWIADGSPQNRKVEKYRNDLIDVLIGVTATYFSGLMSSDKKLVRLHHLASWYLENYSIPLAKLVETNRRRNNT